jgi:hypothetical protein
MFSTLSEKVKDFLTNPVDTFRQSKEEQPDTVFPYFVMLLLLHAAFSAVLAALAIEILPMAGMINGGLSGPVVVFFVSLVAGFVGILVFGAWLHLWVYIFGGRRGIWQTMKAVMYGDTPFLLFGWIPFIGFIFLLWSLVLGILGIRELQDMNSIKAILAVALAVMIPLILVLILAAYFMIASTTTTMVPEPMVSQL